MGSRQIFSRTLSIHMAEPLGSPHSVWLAQHSANGRAERVRKRILSTADPEMEEAPSTCPTWHSVEKDQMLSFCIPQRLRTAPGRIRTAAQLSKRVCTNNAYIYKRASCGQDAAYSKEGH